MKVFFLSKKDYETLSKQNGQSFHKKKEKIELKTFFDIFAAGYDVMESGDRLEHVADENILFMPNHQSTADVPLCMTLFTARTHFADRVMWIMDRIFKYSNFGCVSWMHDDFFILAVSFSNSTLINKLF